MEANKISLKEKIDLDWLLPELPEVHWQTDDDLCNCTFQRIGEWTNPYLGETLRVRLCCIWKELYKMFPQFVQEVKASYDVNRHKWQPEVQEWDSSEVDMPLPIWYRQLARKTGKPLNEIRDVYQLRKTERPKRRTDIKRGINGVTASQPTPEEVRRAHNRRLLETGWLIGGYE